MAKQYQSKRSCLRFVYDMWRVIIYSFWLEDGLQLADEAVFLYKITVVFTNLAYMTESERR